MILKTMGVIDVLIGIILLLSSYNILIGWKGVLISAIYLFIKGLMFRGNLASWLDMSIAVYLIFTLFTMNSVLTWGGSLYLGIKGLQSVIV